jgi:hypothetical protein
VATAEDVKRQVAVAAIVAVEEAAFLVAVQRILRGVQVEDDFLRRFSMRLEEEVDKEAFDGAPVDGDLAVAVVRGPGACSSRFSVLLPPSAAQSGRRGSSRSANSARTGSNRSLS